MQRILTNSWRHASFSVLTRLQRVPFFIDLLSPLLRHWDRFLRLVDCFCSIGLFMHFDEMISFLFANKADNKNAFKFQFYNWQCFWRNFFWKRLNIRSSSLHWFAWWLSGDGSALLKASIATIHSIATIYNFFRILFGYSTAFLTFSVPFCHFHDFLIDFVYSWLHEHGVASTQHSAVCALWTFTCLCFHKTNFSSY